MERTEPIYITMQDTCLAEDKIRPYGGWLGEPSEKAVRDIVEELWDLNNVNRNAER